MGARLHVVADLDHGGAQTQLRLLAADQAARGEAVTVASLRRPGPVAERLRAAGVAVAWLGWRFAWDPFVARRLAAALRSGVGTVHTWDAAAGRHTLAARLVAGAGARWVHAARDLRPPDAAERRVRRSADGVVTPSDEVAQAVGRSGVSPARVAVVPNAADTPVAESSRAAVLRRLGLPAESRLIAAAMRLDEARFGKELVWAADLVRVVRPEVKLVLAGDGPARRRVERFARGASEPGLARLAGGAVDWPELLAAADVVWCASPSPGAPTPLVEAALAAKPAVASEAPGRERLLADGETGWLTRWDDRAGWARATVRALEEPALAERLGGALCERAAAAHGADALAARYDAALA